jgi:hypothetical protein
VIQKKELISLLPFTAKQKTKIKRYDQKIKKEIGQVQEKKRNCYHNILYWLLQFWWHIILLFKNLLKCDEKGLTLNAISIETEKILKK